MKSVRCVYAGSASIDVRVGLTYGKIYEVIHHEKRSRHEWVFIENDRGKQLRYYLEDANGIWFVDALPYIREKRLNELGI